MPLSKLQKAELLKIDRSYKRMETFITENEIMLNTGEGWDGIVHESDINLQQWEEQSKKRKDVFSGTAKKAGE
jgi:hypothetical protein